MQSGFVQCSAITHPGLVRARNEDAIAVSAATDIPPTGWTGSLSSSGGWALVADGIGGHAGGEVASRLVVEFLRPVMPLLTDQCAVAQALAAASNGLFETMDRYPELRGMGTTIAAAILQNDRALVFNVGDSRAYLFQHGRLEEVSVDHAVDGHTLTQCLGGLHGTRQIDPHVRTVRLAAGARLLLCSDGLTDMVANHRIAEIFGSDEPDHASMLLQAALAGGGRDNVSLAVLEITDGCTDALTTWQACDCILLRCSYITKSATHMCGLDRLRAYLESRSKLKLVACDQ
jgi:serine/threonine protein phosphatase PrpC